MGSPGRTQGLTTLGGMLTAPAIGIASGGTGLPLLAALAAFGGASGSALGQAISPSGGTGLTPPPPLPPGLTQSPPVTSQAQVGSFLPGQQGRLSRPYV